MGSLDYSYESIDWWHEALLPDVTFEHDGLLYSHVMNPALTIGLSDYVNATLSQVIGSRTMEYKSANTPHHRNEGSDTDFNNAVGGLLGDTKFFFRYLVLNDGMKGNRFFIGTGFSIPSKNTLTISPYLKNDDESFPVHRHFSMSEGAYKWSGELQFFRKLHPPIIFWGGSATITVPIKENEYGFLPSTYADLSFNILTKKIKIINASLGMYIQWKYSSYSKWDGVESSNSESSILVPGFGFIWTKNSMGYSINMLFPQLLTGDLAGIESETRQEVTAVQISLGFRKTFDYIIPFLE